MNIEFRNPWTAAACAAVCTLLTPLQVAAQTTMPLSGPDVGSPIEMLTQGQLLGTARAIYFSAHNSFFVPKLNQDTASYGGKLGFRTGRLNGVSLGLSGYVQRPLLRSDNPSKVDGYIGPDVTAMGEAYARWENKDLAAVLGNQQIDLPFAARYDFRMAEQLFQGLSLRYGKSDDNYVTAVRMLRYKPYTADSFLKLTTYNSNVDRSSPIGRTETDGFYGLGGVKTLPVGDMSAKLQGWYFDYLDYARLGYVEGQLDAKMGEFKPFVAAQIFVEKGSGRELLGRVDAQVHGLQVGLKRNSATLTLNYNRTRPNADSYANGALVTPYSHQVSSGPLFAQPFLSSAQDLGAGDAYSINFGGSPAPGWFAGVRYSYMDLVKVPNTPSLKQTEIMGFVSYKFSGSLRGLSIINFLAMQDSQVKSARYVQNRLTVQYDWAPGL